MEFQEVMQQLEELGKERSKKMYMSNGAQEPLFGVTTGSMKPIAKRIKKDQALAEALYATGNYDAMYFAGVIADPDMMTVEDFNRWIDRAYFYMLSDFVVAVTLAEAPIAEEVADQWIASDDELKMSAGWNCYCWMLGNKKDAAFQKTKLAAMLKHAQATIHSAPPRTQAAINNFVTTVGVSYKPLHEEAVAIANAIGEVEMHRPNKKPTMLHAAANIQKEIDKARIGFKRKHVRC